VQTGWLALTAFSIGLTHTLLGPDHYVPFVAMSRARNWSLRKTLVVTLLCGVGHVGSSVLLGLVGLGGGILLQSLTDVEQARGDWAAWLLIGFGLAYATWGVGRAIRGIQHAHLHAHADGTWHAHEHSHEAEHLHVHEPVPLPSALEPSSGAMGREPKPIGREESLAGAGGEVTPWVLFTIFLFGPCEPLIPLFMYPAAEQSYSAAALVALVFGAATLLAMTGCVFVLWQGVSALRLRRLDRYSHALAGLAITACGVAVKLGL